jgi:hypothetical protein
MDAEGSRLEEERTKAVPWRKWGLYYHVFDATVL